MAGASMDWIEVKILTTTEGIEPVTGALLSLGIQGMIIQDKKDLERFLAGETAARWDYVDDQVLAQQDQESNIRVYLAEHQQGREQLLGLRQALDRLRLEDGEGIYGSLAILCTNVKEEDWANNWKAYFKPFSVGQKLLVKPTWEPVPSTETRTILEIDPGSSFGTGQHDTTRLCLEQLEALVQPGDRILDLGCGSGILSIAALLLGANTASAVDVEEHSARVAAENAAQNNLSEDRFKTYVGDITSDQALLEKLGYGQGSFDLVVANIVADVILAMCPYFAGFVKDQGHLLVSGIIHDRQPEVQAAIEAQGFKLEARREERDWNAMVFCRKDAYAGN
jgi:ribosomal protein L11 methyltransferase